MNYFMKMKQTLLLYAHLTKWQHNLSPIFDQRALGTERIFIYT